MAQFSSFQAFGDELLKQGYHLFRGRGSAQHAVALDIAGQTYVSALRTTLFYGGETGALAPLSPNTVARRPDQGDDPLHFSGQIYWGIRHQVNRVGDMNLHVGVMDTPYEPKGGYGTAGESLAELVVRHEYGDSRMPSRPLFGDEGLIRFTTDLAVEAYSSYIIRTGLTRKV